MVMVVDAEQIGWDGKEEYSCHAHGHCGKCLWRFYETFDVIHQSHDAYRDPSGENEHRSYVEIITLTRLGLLLILIQGENRTQNNEHTEKDEPHFPVLSELIVESQKPDQERNRQRILPVNACILVVACLPDIVPADITEKHMIQLIPD